MRRVLPFCLVLAGLLFSPATSAGQSPSWRISLGQLCGFADNMLSTSALDPAVDPMASAFYEATPEAALAIRVHERLTLSARYLGEIAVFGAEQTEVRQWHDGGIGVRVDLGSFALFFDVGGAGYGFTAFPEDGFGQSGGRIAAAWQGAGLFVLAAGSVTGRFFLEPGGTIAVPREDSDAGGRLAVGWSAPFGLRISATWDFLRRFSNEPVVNRLYHSPGVSVGLDIWRIQAEVAYAATLREAVEGGVDTYHELSAEVRGRLTGWLDVVARYRLSADRTERGDLDFSAHEVGAGLRFTLGTTPRHTGMAGLDLPPEEPAPAGEGTRFRTRRPGATRVAVVGDFNGWSPDEGRMTGPDEAGWFEVVLPLQPGRYEYQIWVDGRFCTPEGAARLVRTGFGEPNGVVEVK